MDRKDGDVRQQNVDSIGRSLQIQASLLHSLHAVRVRLGPVHFKGKPLFGRDANGHTQRKIILRRSHYNAREGVIHEEACLWTGH